ncbi:hypothetical protein DFH05DRAFT_1127263 [Lentinula detonsa]|uniref:Uncharacterized protein n=1 Tax=Lentinula detonsa TaxID=2804962 RepID=A0A9W8P1P0_9AGAR|nr:hypothetical protein DFH05DRAFT_1127263 [Lentinula detonsa]
MTSNNRRNKHGKGLSKDPAQTPGRTPGPSRSQSATPSAPSRPLPGAASGSGGADGGSGGQHHTGFNGTVPKHIYDFSKALAGEVRILLAEVGQLREERRQLQYEIAEIMALKSKDTATHGDYGGMPGGMNFDHPDALAYAMAGLALPPPPGHIPQDPNLALAPMNPSAPPEPSAPAWRTVHKRAERKPRAKKAAGGVPQSIPSPSQVPPLEIPKPNVPAWAQWRPNPLLSPAPQHGQFPGGPATPQLPGAGLFGPPSPPPK